MLLYSDTIKEHWCIYSCFQTPPKKRTGFNVYTENAQQQLTFLALLPWVALPILSILVYLSKNVKLCKYYTLRIPGDLYLAVWKDLATNWNVRTYRRTQILEPTGGLKYWNLQGDSNIYYRAIRQYLYIHCLSGCLSVCIQQTSKRLNQLGPMEWTLAYCVNSTSMTHLFLRKNWQTKCSTVKA